MIKRIICSILLLFLLDASVVAQNEQSSKGEDDPVTVWHDLVEDGQFDEARDLCVSWLGHNDRERIAEAHICLANLAIQDASLIMIEGDRSGGVLRSGFHPVAVDSALRHLGSAMRLVPTDMSVHEGRLYLALQAGQYGIADSLLAESLALLPFETDMEVWLPYAQWMFDSKQYRPAIDYSKVLETRYPDDHRLVANIGAFLTMLEQDEEALTYVARAVELDPEDPINNWNLGRLYMYLGDTEEANRYYRVALDLLPEGDPSRDQWFCLYADFADKHLEEEMLACELKERHCHVDEQCRPRSE